MRKLLPRFTIRCLLFLVGVFLVALASYLPTLNATRFCNDFQQHADNGNLRWLAPELRREIQNAPDHRRLIPTTCVHYSVSLMPQTLNDGIHFRRRIRLQHHGARKIRGPVPTNATNQKFVNIPADLADNKIEVLLVIGINRISIGPNTTR